MFRDVNLDLLQLFEFGVVGVKVDWKVRRCWRVGLETGEQSSFYTNKKSKQCEWLSDPPIYANLIFPTSMSN